jgi:hypothetical protein
MAKPKNFGTSDCVSVRRLYDNFLRNATTLIGRQGVTFDAQNLAEKLSVELNGTGKIIVKTRDNCGFWFFGLPRHKGNKSNVIKACLTLKQDIVLGEKGCLVLLNSNVHVSYFEEVRHGKHKILESWHFDFAPNQEGHPIFHAQLTEDHYPLPSPTYKYSPAHRKPDLKDLPRVPTPPLDLAAIMEMLVADHLPEYTAIVDSTDWRKAAEGLPQLPMAHFSSWKLSAIDKLKARHWYPKD